MEKRDKRKEDDYYYDWDDSVYSTGRTEPPKNRGGLVALMLILLIFLSGIVTVLGVLNIKMFRELKVQENQDELTISFSTEPTVPPPTHPVAIANEIQEEVMPFGNLNLHPSPQSIANVPVEGGMALQDIYTQNIPSVVSISCQGYGSSSTGTGVVLSADGYVVTNAHVVEDAMSISVQLTDDRIFPAQVVGRDEVSDLAVLYISVTGLTPAQFGDSNALQVGDTVVAIGDPLGVEFRGTYTNGIVSAINRDVDMDGRTMTLIQTNAALNSGNSGGPLINCYGQVIGINTMKIGAFTDAAGVEGLGFAIPSVTVKDIVDQLISQGYVSGRPTLGIQGEALSSFYQHYYRLPAGLYITYVEPGSPADSKGITDGDLLLAIGDQRLTTMEELKNILYSLQVGDTVQATVYRAGQRYLVEMVLTEDKG